MVHSVIKRKRSSDGLSDLSREQPLTANQPAHGAPTTGLDNNWEKIDISQPLPVGNTDPRPTVFAILNFLSNSELFTLITSRLSQANPWESPLFLTPFLIMGIRDFFIPPRAATVPLPTGPLSPFSQLPTIFDEKGRIKGKITSPNNTARSKEVLVSLATLFSFLTPSELRILIYARISASQAPHYGVKWFLEFMQSGGDGVPRGKKDIEMRKAKQREKLKTKIEETKRLKVEKRLSQRQNEIQLKNAGALPDAMANAGPVLISSVSDVRAASFVQPYDVDVEPGGILPVLSLLAAADRAPGVGGTTAGNALLQPMVQKREKKRYRGPARNSDILDMPYGGSVGKDPTTSMVSSAPVTHPTKPEIPGLETSYHVEPLQP